MSDDDKQFKSFKDLLKSTGGGPLKEEEAAAKQKKKGWVLETGDEVRGSGDFDDFEGSSRERIDARPPGFGVMTHGPAPYRDEESEEMELLASFRIRTVFPPKVLEEVGVLPGDPSAADFEGREDLRDETIFTVDGADAKDYDDAIQIRADGDGFEVSVHIADVAHYVVPGTQLDDEALARGTSVYVADQVVPMLPEELSNGLCSLVEGRPRLAYSVRMTFDAQGERTAARVHKSVIHSKRRCTYKAVQELLDGEDTEDARALAFLEPDLRLFEKWTQLQQRKREQRGAFNMDSSEKKFQFDDEHEVSAIVDAPRYFSQKLIEETALAANQAVGDLFRKRGLPTIYRVHPEKDPEEIASVAKMLLDHGLRVPDKERLTGRDISRLIRAARRKSNADALIQRIMGLIERAVYEVKDHEDVAQHFGLAREAYLHFTSPIRRYPDLLVHRWLWAIESRGEEAEVELKAEALVQDMNDIAAHCSVRADLAEMAERAIFDLKVCQYMEPHIGETLDAMVRRVSIAGIEVFLTDYNVSAFLPRRTIGGRGEVKGPTLRVHVGRAVKSFTEGYPIRVKLTDVDFLRLQVLLDLP